MCVGWTFCFVLDPVHETAYAARTAEHVTSVFDLPLVIMISFSISRVNSSSMFLNRNC